MLAARRPDDAVLGEEGDDVAGSSGLRWVVDPLDGTINYLFGIPQWCVSVACEGRVGVILDPLRDELFTVRVGEAALLDGEPLRRSRRDDLATAMVATGFGYDTGVRAAQAAVVARLLPQVRDIRRLGSAALDLAWLAAGRYDAYYEYGLNAWDWAAGEMLCSAVGPGDPPPRSAAGHGRRAPRRHPRDRRRARGDRHRMTAPEPRPTARRPGGVAGRVAHRQLLAAQPRAQALGVAGQLDPVDAARVAARAGIPDARVALDEERQPRLGHRLGHAGQARREAVALDRGHLQPEALGVGRHVLHRDRPAEEAVGRGRHRAADDRGGRLLGVGDGQHLEVAAAEREDAVVRADPDVAPAAGVAQPVLAREAVRGGVEVDRRPDDVVDAH